MAEEAGKYTGKYTIKNPKSVGHCKAQPLTGGVTLEEWDIEDRDFYEKEGLNIATRNLWASIPNLLMGFAVWLMWSVISTKIQAAHTADPGVYYFKDFAPSIDGINEGFRGCPGWYDRECCSTWQKASKDGVFDDWQTKNYDGATPYSNADDFMYSKDFKDLKTAPASKDGPGGFYSPDEAYGCKVDADRNKAYKAALYVIGATAGLSGGIFRLPNSFVVPFVGGRNVVYMTSIGLATPCLWAGIALMSADVYAIVIVFAAMMSGVGGGAFASSMANINPFYPRRRAGFALGMNGGLGNLGVSLCQLFLANVLMVYGASSSAVGGLWVANGPWFLFPLCVLSTGLAWLFMNNMPKDVHPAVPDGFFQMLCNYASFQGPAYITSAIGVAIIYATRNLTAPAEAIPITIGIIVVVSIIEHAFMYFLVPKAAKPALSKGLAIFKNKHNYVMTYLYIMTFGSFIGFSSAFPKLILDIFDEYGPKECAELQLKGTLEQGDCSYTGWPVEGFSPAFLGALIGSLIRPLGGMMSDKWGGARVTHYHTVLMTAVTIGLGVIVKYAREAEENRIRYFAPFMVCFMILFYCTGVGNGSTFQQIAVIFDKSLAPPVLGWSSAIASFGAFLIPKFFATAIQQGAPETPFYIFGAYYFTCIVVNWWFYLRIHPNSIKPGTAPQSAKA